MAKPVTSYTPEVGERVCALIANGWSVGKIGRAPGLPSRTTIFTWLATADAEPKEGEEAKARPFDAFRQMYLRARELRAEARFERIDQVVHDMRIKKIDPQVARVEIDAIKWQLAKENQTRYGDKVTLRGDKEAPMQLQSTVTVELSETQLHAIAAKGLAGGAE